MTSYTRVNFQVGPDGATPCSSANMDILETGIYNAHEEIKPLIPLGSIAFYCKNTAPTGWLFCDGTSYSTATYPDLFALISYNFGGSGGSFNIPNLRGLFIRGFDGRTTGTRDQWYAETGSARTIRTLQADSIAAHAHGYTSWQHANHLGGGGWYGQISIINEAAEDTSTNPDAASVPNMRPKNVALLPIIKAVL